jgi:hypothetical protein
MFLRTVVSVETADEKKLFENLRAQNIFIYFYEIWFKGTVLSSEKINRY